MITEPARRASKSSEPNRGLGARWVRAQLVPFLALVALAPARVDAQLSAALLDEQTEVGSIDFRFEGTSTYSRLRLLDAIAMTERGALHGTQRALSFLPLLDPPAPHRFEPLSLQRDVARLRAFYHRGGFPGVQIRYEVALDEERNVVAVTFVIDEGVPRTLASLDWRVPDGRSLESTLPQDLLPAWVAFTAREREAIDERLGDDSRARLEANTLTWLLDRGYPFAVVRSGLAADSTAVDTGAPGLRAALDVIADPGARSRVGTLAVAGTEAVADGVVLREVRLREGDWYSASRLRDGRRRIVSLPPVGSAVADVTPGQAADSTVDILLRVREGHKRRVSGHVGYTNVGGIALGGQWENLNFFGGARSLVVSATTETGVAATFTDAPDKYVRGTVAVQQPFVFVPGLSLVVSPFAEYRDDYRDESWEVGLDATLLYQYAPLRAVSLRYRGSHREVLEFPLTGEDAPRSGSTPESVFDALEERITVSVLTLSGTFGTLADVANPTSGLVVQPIVEVSIPRGFPTNEYVKGEVWGGFYQSLPGSWQLAVGARAGRIFPFGKSIPATDEDRLAEVLQLRDVTLTAGGPSDVRGWASRLLGPKVPDLLVSENGSGVTYSAARYLPLGGLSRLSGALELAHPLGEPTSGFTGHVFLDGARVWTDDARLELEDVYDQTKTFFSTGVGLGLRTPVGPVRLSIGYKLNPSVLDLRDPGDVLAAILEGRPIEDVPERASRRFQLHLTVGRPF